MQVLALVSAVFALFNCILLGVVIFILKQPDPSRGKITAEILEVGERINECMKAVMSLERKLEKALQDSKSEQVAKIDRLTKDVGRQLKEIHDNL